MGTRALIFVYYKGEYRIVQYVHQDGYPSNQGIKILTFIREPENLAKLKTAFDTPGRIFEPTEDQVNAWQREMYFQEQDWYERLRSDPRAKPPQWLYPTIDLDTGADILKIVAESAEPVPIVTNPYMEHLWKYDINLDAATLEVSGGREVRKWKLSELPGDSEFRVIH